VSGIETIAVNAGERAYNVLIGEGALEQGAEELVRLAKRPQVYLLADDHAAERHMFTLGKLLRKAGLKPSVLLIPGGERAKTFPELQRALEFLLQHGAERGDLVVSFGGGAVSDLAGLAAALCKRGMLVAHIPTTLLSQADSAIGGKTAINAQGGKNAVGLIYQPCLVIADPRPLSTLPEREHRAGYAEIYKYGLIDDPEHAAWCEEHGEAIIAGDQQLQSEAIVRSAKAKARFVQEDEHDTEGKRALLNLGHTFAHALEATQRSTGGVRHGEAVAAGLGAAFAFSQRLGLCTKKDAKRVSAHLNSVGLPSNLDVAPGGPYATKDVLAAMRQDKKVDDSKLSMILVRGVGKAFLEPSADVEALEAFLKEQF
jgi:3-dehydroquinate synthase